jgi:Fic family protein
MIYATPALEEIDQTVLGMIAEQRGRLRHLTQNSPRRWTGSLRRATLARAIQGSNSIEGYRASIDAVVAAIENEPPLDERTETWAATVGYRNAMTYIMQGAQDPHFEFSKQFLKSLHFMIASYDMNNQPGQWRTGVVYVVNQKSGKRVYEPPMPEAVNDLVEELVSYLQTNASDPAIIRAAMAHLNLTMIHPFKDGNGRVARALQTLVIALDGILHPTFSSIEEWLGANTQGYYDILAVTGQGKWNPQGSALLWVRFCLTAHYQQSARLLRRNEEAEGLYNGIASIIAEEKLPERAWLPLFDAAIGLTVTNQRYRTDADITEFTASRDLKRLCEAALLVPKGERRARTYSAAKILAELRIKTRISRPIENPYDMIRDKNIDRIIQEVADASAQLENVMQSPRLPGI